jgi:hypothetical protein
VDLVLKKILAILFAIIAIVSMFFFTRDNDDGLEKHVFNDEEYGEITFDIPEGALEMNFEGIHLLMKRSDVEKLDLIDDYEKAGIPAEKSFGYSTNDELSVQLRGEYSLLSDGEYLNDTGEKKTDQLVYLLSAMQSTDEFFGVSYNQPFHVAANTLLNQGFEYVRGREDKDTRYIHYELFKKGDLYIVLKNSVSLSLVEQIGDLNRELDRVGEIMVEIKTDVDKFISNENLEFITLLSEIQNSHELPENEILTQRPVVIKKEIDRDVDIESVVYTSKSEANSEEDDISYKFETGSINDKESIIKLTVNANGRNVEMYKFPRIFEDKSLKNEINYDVSLKDNVVILKFNSNVNEVFVHTPELLVFEELNGVETNFNIDDKSGKEIKLNNKKWLEITESTIHRPTIKLSYTAIGQKNFAPSKISIYMDAYDLLTYRNEAIMFDDKNNFKSIDFISGLPYEDDTLSEIKVVIEEMAFKVDDGFVEKLILK